VGLFLLNLSAPEDVEYLVHYQGPRDLAALKGSLSAAYRVSHCTTIDFIGDHIAAFAPWLGPDPTPAVQPRNEHPLAASDADFEDFRSHIENREAVKAELVLCLLVPKGLCYSERRCALGWCRATARLGMLRNLTIPVIPPFRFEYSLCKDIMPCFAPRALREIVAPLYIENKSPEHSCLGHLLLCHNMVLLSTLPPSLAADCMLWAQYAKLTERSDESADVFDLRETMMVGEQQLLLSTVAFEDYVDMAVFQTISKGPNGSASSSRPLVDPLSTEVRFKYLSTVANHKLWHRAFEGLPRRLLQLDLAHQRVICEPQTLLSPDFMVQALRLCSSQLLGRSVSEVGSVHRSMLNVACVGQNGKIAVFEAATSPASDLAEQSFRICAL
jgi:hypothetical protein